MVATIPGQRFISQPVRGARGVASRTGRAFVAGLAEQGSTTAPTLVTSLGDFTAKLGESRSLSVLPDWVELYFDSGGAELVVARTVGGAAARASRVLNDGAAPPVPVGRVEAIDVGEYGNRFSVEVVAGSTGGLFTLVVFDNTADPDEELERHTDLASVSAAVEALLASAYVRGVDLAATGSPNPAVAEAAALTGGTDDRAAVLVADHVAALDLVAADQGAGQVALPGQTSAAAHAGLIAHAEARNRFALLDAADGADAAALLAVAVADRADLDSSWVEMAPLSGARNRKVPSSALRAGLYARGDALFGHANHAPAGDDGRSPAVVGVTREVDEGDKTALANGGVNVIRVNRSGGRAIVERFGSRTRNPDGDYAQVGWMRYEMSVQDRFDEIASRWLFQILADRRKIAQYGAELRSVLAADYALPVVGPLFGDPVDDALFVDVGVEVNTLATLAAGQLRSQTGLKLAPFAELVINTYSKIAIDQPLRAA